MREVEIDGMRFRFQLRAAPPGEAPHIEGGPSPAPQPVLRSTRPADMATPYDLMVQNGVIFGSPDRASGRFLTAAMYGLYTVLLFGAVGRLLPGRGGGGAGSWAPLWPEAGAPRRGLCGSCPRCASPTSPGSTRRRTS